MNYIITLLAAVLLFSGCTPTEEAQKAPSHQVLVKVSSLPSYTPNVFSRDMNMRVAFRVLSDGSIAEAQVIESAADSAWNSTATGLMKQWRFTPISGSDEPDGRWIQYSLVVHVEDPMMMNLGEIVAPSREDADSLYALLDNDVPFDSIAKQSSVASSGVGAKFLGSVDIAAYPQNVRDELRILRVNHFTRPLRLGNSYVIYKRFHGETLRTLAQ